MKNKRGFTLIELLAVIVILGVILVIAIPSISSAILNSRKNAYVATANEFVDGLRMMTLPDASLLPSGSTPTCKKPSEIKLEKGSNTKSPFGKTFVEEDLTKSRVCVAYDSDTKDYIYSVCLVDEGNNRICNIDENDDYVAINIKDVTKDSVVVGGNIVHEPLQTTVVLSKGTSETAASSDITGAWIHKCNSCGDPQEYQVILRYYNGSYYPPIYAPYENTQSKIYTSNKIDITGYKTITVSGYAKTDYNWGFNSTIILGLKSAVPTFSNTDFDYSETIETGVIGNYWVPFSITLDTSQISGKYYLIIGVNHPSSPWAYTSFAIVDNITLNP